MVAGCSGLTRNRGRKGGVEQNGAGGHRAGVGFLTLDIGKYDDYEGIACIFALFELPSRRQSAAAAGVHFGATFTIRESG